MPRPAPGEPPCAVLLNTSGGIVGGDALQVEVRLEAGAAAVITSQAAEKAYRSAGADATLDVALDLADGAWLEWLPQETILFDGARLRRRLRVDAAAQARLVAADMLVFGRRARGERFQRGFLYDSWEVRIGRRLAWVDALRLAPEPGPLLDARFGFAVGRRGGDRNLHRARCRGSARPRPSPDRPPEGAQRRDLHGAGARPALAGRRSRAVRAAVQQFCARFRHAVAGLPERGPGDLGPEPKPEPEAMPRDSRARGRATASARAIRTSVPRRTSRLLRRSADRGQRSSVGTRLRPRRDHARSRSPQVPEAWRQRGAGRGRRSPVSDV